MDEKLSAIVGDWVKKNRKLFWKYEVSCFYKTYKISIRNFPCPANSDIAISPANAMPVPEKKRLSDAIIREFGKGEGQSGRCVMVKVDYADGDVTAAVL